MANNHSLAPGFQPEGYIFLDNKTFQDADSDGLPMSEVRGNDSLFLTVHRKMFIRGHHLIEVNENVHFADGKYSKTDTIGYTFYDFETQKFISFETLSPDSKITKRGLMMDPGGSFSNTPINDPMNGVSDSIWKVTDTIINGDSIGIVNFFTIDGAGSMEIDLSKRTNFWINYRMINFPIQMSYILSKKLKNGFVYKMQLPSPDGRSIMVTSLDYQPVKLPDTLTKIFIKWSQVANE